MRAALTLDDDIAARLQDVAGEQGITFEAAISNAIRAGLECPGTPRPIRVKPRPMGPAKVDLTKALQIASELEDEDVVRKIDLDK